MTQIITPKYKDHYPVSMGFAEGFFGPKGDVGFMMAADYETAKMILENIIESGRPVERAVMGLDGDWDYNSVEIWDGTDHVEYDAHGSSQWAEPLMIVYFKDGTNEAYSVWRNENEMQQLGS